MDHLDFPKIVTGNACRGVDGERGWFVGAFLDATTGRGTSDVEVKWGQHEAGEERRAWGLSRVATTMSILISGRFRIEFPEQEIILARASDYVIWPPGLPHSWRAEEPSVVITVRWPSAPGDCVDTVRPRTGASFSTRVPTTRC